MLHKSINSPVVELLRVDSKSLSSVLHALHLIGLTVPWLFGKLDYTTMSGQDLMISVLSVVSIVSIQLDTLVLRVQQSQHLGSTVPLLYKVSAPWPLRTCATQKSYPKVIHSLSTIHPQPVLPVYKCS